MKLGPVTELHKRNKATSKTFDDDVMSANCDDIVIFRIYGQFGAMFIFWKKILTSAKLRGSWY